MSLSFLIAIAFGVAGMTLRLASLRELSPLGEKHRKSIRNGLVPFDRRHYTQRGQRFLMVARAFLLLALVLAVFSVVATGP